MIYKCEFTCDKLDCWTLEHVRAGFITFGSYIQGICHFPVFLILDSCSSCYGFEPSIYEEVVMTIVSQHLLLIPEKQILGKK